MAVPELKAKKVARAATQAKAARTAAIKADADAAAFHKAISGRAAAYEAEYAKVSSELLIHPVGPGCMH